MSKKKKFVNWRNMKPTSVRDTLGYRTCFYTGMRMKFRVEHGNPMMATTEHLVSSSYHKKMERGIEKNLVLACAFINTLVGNAPLRVKYQIRETIRNLNVLPILTEEQLIAMYSKIAQDILKSYRIEGINVLPWNWNACRDRKYREKLKARFYEILTDEEKILFDKYNSYKQKKNQLHEAA